MREARGVARDVARGATLTVSAASRICPATVKRTATAWTPGVEKSVSVCARTPVWRAKAPPPRSQAKPRAPDGAATTSRTGCRTVGRAGTAVSVAAVAPWVLGATGAPMDSVAPGEVAWAIGAGAATTPAQQAAAMMRRPRI